MKMPELELNLKSPYIRDLTKRILFIDIETSLIEARIFRTGTQTVTANQLTSRTKVLTVAGGWLYDLLKGDESGMWSCSNHRSSTFKTDPLDDTEILADVWQELDRAEVVVAHNASFDQGWLFGRFLELGWQLPSKFFLFCTYRNLTPFNLTSKKLDELSKSLIGTKKLPTDFSLWSRCSDGDIDAFKEMEAYNRGDVYNTLYKVWKRTAYYNPHKAIDFANPNTDEILCKVDGGCLLDYPTKYNRKNGLHYYRYKNPRSGTVYIDRYNTKSSKAGQGFICPELGY